MKIAVWKTGHAIADTVAGALREGFNADVLHAIKCSDELIKSYSGHICYGILRGADAVFERANENGVGFWNVDRGYFSPSHFDGYYRISHCGTQARYVPGGNNYLTGGSCTPPDLEPFRKGGAYVLICPPTDAVCEFFGLSLNHWIMNASNEVLSLGMKPILRMKGDESPIFWDRLGAVITFNSSVGWEAVRRGIPCLSSVEHSVVGSFYGEKTLDGVIAKFNHYDRNLLFSFMRAHQFTLGEIRMGKAWPLIKHYLSGSDMTDAKPSPPQCAPIPSAAGPNPRFQSIT